MSALLGVAAGFLWFMAWVCWRRRHPDAAVWFVLGLGTFLVGVGIDLLRQVA